MIAFQKKRIYKDVLFQFQNVKTVTRRFVRYLFILFEIPNIFSAGNFKQSFSAKLSSPEESSCIICEIFVLTKSFKMLTKKKKLITILIHFCLRFVFLQNYLALEQLLQPPLAPLFGSTWNLKGSH